MITNHRTVILAATLSACSAAPGVHGQERPTEGSPRMIGIEAVEEILTTAEADLSAVLERVIAPAWWQRAGKEDVRARAKDLRARLEGMAADGARPMGPYSAALQFGELRVLFTVESEPPHRLTEVTIAGAGAMDTPPEPPVATGPGYVDRDALFRAFLSNLGEGRDDELMRGQMAPRFLERYGDAETRTVLAELRESLGPSDGAYPLVAAERDGGDWYVTTANARGEERRFLILPTDESPFLLRGFDTSAAPAMRERVAPSEWPSAIQAMLDEREQRDEFSGAVVVARNGTPIHVGTWGWADHAQGRRLRPDTPINVGSMNKMFTGLAVAQLVAEGRLQYDAPVGRYLPDYPNRRVREEVTLHHLLTHTSGVPSYWNAAFAAARDTLDTLAEIAATFRDEPLSFPPGTAWEYSNGGPVILGLIIERVTGMSYYDYVDEHIYAPAGMTHTAHYLATDDAGMAVGYQQLRSGIPAGPNTGMMGLRGSPAGGGYSTVLDLMRFAAALSDGRLLAPERLEELWSPPRTGSEEDRYGYLWGSATVNGQRHVGHNGGAPGVSADFRYFPESGLMLAVLSNLSGAAMPVSEWLTQLVTSGT